jgi:hypothetical protein
MISTIAQLQDLVSVSAQLTYKKISPFNEITKNKYFKNYFSDALIAELLSYSTATGIKKDAYNLYMISFAHLLIKEAMPSIEVVVTDGGITRNENQQSKTAYSGQIKNLQNSMEEIGFMNFELLVDLMNENSSDFTNWEDSPGYASTSHLLIQTSNDFNRYFKLFRPSVTFKGLLASLETVQTIKIEKEITTSNLNIIKDADTDLKKHVLRYVKGALAHFTIADELENASIQVGSDGIRIISHDYNTSRTIESALDPVAAYQALTSAKSKANKYLEEAKTKIRDNQTVFTPIADKYKKQKPWM